VGGAIDEYPEEGDEDLMRGRRNYISLDRRYLLQVHDMDTIRAADAKSRQAVDILKLADAQNRPTSEWESSMITILLSESKSILRKGVNASGWPKCKWCDRVIYDPYRWKCCSDKCTAALERSFNVEVKCSYCKHVVWIRPKKAAKHTGFCSSVCYKKAEARCEREINESMRYDYQDKFRRYILSGDARDHPRHEVADKRKPLKYSIKLIQTWIDTSPEEFFGRFQQATK
jgi:hypothetical protein